MDIAFSKFEVVMDKRFEVLEERFTERQVVVYCDGVMENTIMEKIFHVPCTNNTQAKPFGAVKFHQVINEHTLYTIIGCYN
jgi:hypothetical protein